MYKKVLIAVDFHGDGEQVIRKGHKIAQENDAELYLLHVNEPLAIAYSVDGMGFGDQIVSLESSIRKESQLKMEQVASDLGVPDTHRIVCNGNPASEIHEFAKAQNIDLIVMGTHGQSGLQLLLGSTANSVLHGVSCDVLSVRIQD